MKNKIMLMFGVMLLAAGLMALPVGATNGVTVTVNAQAEVAEDTDFVVSVDISDVTNLYSAQYVVSFDDTVLELTSVTAGVVGGVTFPIFEYNPATYSVVQLLAGGVTGSGYMAELNFHVIGSAGDTSNIDLTAGMITDTEAVEIEATWTGDSVTVVEVAPPTLTTSAATNVKHSSATLNGVLTSLGDYTEVQVRFEYGPTVAYGSTTSWQTRTTTGAFSAGVTGLTPVSTYHFRAQVKTVAPTDSLTVNGGDMYFMTTARPQSFVWWLFETLIEPYL